MPNPSGPDRDHKSNAAGFDPDAADRGTTSDPAESDANAAEQAAGPDEEVTESHHTAPTTAEPATEVMARAQREPEASQPRRPRGERRFTAPGFDAKETA